MRDNLTCSHRPNENCSDFDDRTVCTLGFLLGVQVVDAVEFQHVLVVLLLEQEDVLLQEDDVKIDILLSFCPPRQGALVDQTVLCQLKVLKYQETLVKRLKCDNILSKHIAIAVVFGYAGCSMENSNNDNTLSSLAMAWSDFSNADLSSRRWISTSRL